MGCNVGKIPVTTPTTKSPQTPEPQKRGIDIEEFLKDEKFKSLTHFKVLLLGAGESGKTTVIKQLKAVHKIGMSRAELHLNKVALHSNCLTSMQKFIEAAAQFGYSFPPEEEAVVNLVKKYELDRNTELITPEVAEAIHTLWKQSPTIAKVAQRRNEFWNLDASDYYFHHAVRFTEPGFVPTEEDCIMARIRTTGIALTDFDQGPVHFQVVDVGGQRSERKKWIHCFDDVKAIVFIVSLVGYNQVLFEDEEKNRMEEALQLFQETAANQLFATTPLFLFLNKKDLFEVMIRTKDLSCCFPDYKDGPDVQKAIEFIKSEFRKRMPDGQAKRLYIYEIAARFKKDVKFCWEQLTEVLLEHNREAIKKAAKVGKEKFEKDLKKLKV